MDLEGSAIGVVAAEEWGEAEEPGLGVLMGEGGGDEDAGEGD